MAWEKWQQDTAAIKEQKRLMIVVLLKMKKRQLSRAFEKWLHINADDDRITALLEKIIKKMRHRSLDAAWGTWRHYVQCVALARAQFTSDQLKKELEKMKEEGEAYQIAKTKWAVDKVDFEELIKQLKRQYKDEKEQWDIDKDDFEEIIRRLNRENQNLQRQMAEKEQQKCPFLRAPRPRSWTRSSRSAARMWPRP